MPPNIHATYTFWSFSLWFSVPSSSVSVSMPFSQVPCVLVCVHVLLSRRTFIERRFALIPPQYQPLQKVSSPIFLSMIPNVFLTLIVTSTFAGLVSSKLLSLAPCLLSISAFLHFSVSASSSFSSQLRFSSPLSSRVPELEFQKSLTFECRG